MRYYGTIIRWNESRNFGAIREESTENEIFLQLSAFHGKPTPPFEGQRVSFHIIKGRRGRDEAQNVRFADDLDGLVFTSDAPYINRPGKSSRAAGIILGILLATAVFGGSGWYGWQTWQAYRAQTQAQTNEKPVSMVAEVAAQMKEERKAWKEAVKSSSTAPVRQPLALAGQTQSSSSFTCDNRQYCSQMTSREEAEFFIKHCPHTKMDSDGDGIPCEHDSRW